MHALGLPGKGPEKSTTGKPGDSEELEASQGYLARDPATERAPVSFPRMCATNTLWERLL